MGKSYSKVNVEIVKHESGGILNLRRRILINDIRKNNIKLVQSLILGRLVYKQNIR